LTLDRTHGLVETERVFRTSHWVVYLALTCAQLALFGALLVRARWWWLALVVVLPGACLYPARWLTLPLMRRPRFLPASDGWRVAVVTTFVPGAEPYEMLRQTVQAVVAMRYPHETWVLDEGNDDRVKAMCEELGVHHFSRADHPEYDAAAGRYAMGTKHGNYNVWLAEIDPDRYDIVMNIDPDHIPVASYLERTLGYFDDPAVGYVQVAQVYYNQPASLVARGAAEETYTYYSSFQMSSYALGYPIVTGSHTVHRCAALVAVGGYAPHEADDLLITMLYRAADWQGVYVPETLARGITPVDWPSYLVQQRRWARSVIDIKLRWFRKSAKDLPLLERAVSLVQGLFYLSGLGIAVGLVALSVLLVTGSRAVSADGATIVLFVALLIVLLGCELFRQWFCLNRREELGLQWRAKLLRFGKWPWFVVALVEVVRGPTRGYTMTRKTERAGRHFVLAPPHLGAAALLVAAASIGLVRGRPTAALTYVVATAFVALCVIVVATELPPAPPPYDASLATSRGWPPAE
jgi:cellulose synthase (UDP-forming)